MNLIFLMRVLIFKTKKEINLQMLLKSSPGQIAKEQGITLNVLLILRLNRPGIISTTLLGFMEMTIPGRFMIMGKE